MKGEKGFTLIELLVVIIIIAILAAIAIPTFLGQRSKAQDASAKSLVRNAMTAMESAYVDSRTYDPDVVDTDVLGAIEPSITFTADDAAVAVGGDTPAITEIGDADTEEVGYFGTDDSYSIATVSLSGNLFGVSAVKSSDGTTEFVKQIGEDGDVTVGW